MAFTLIISFLVFKRRNDRDIDNEYGDDNFSRIVNSIYELGTQVRCSIVLTSFFLHSLPMQTSQETLAEEVDRVAQSVLKEFSSNPDTIIGSIVTWY